MHTAGERQHRLRGMPSLLLREQTPASGGPPILYIHGATFPSALSIMFRFDGASWADSLNRFGFSVWGLDFAGFGGSERYIEMAADAPPAGEPLGRAPAAALQIERAVRYIAGASGHPSVSIVAHSWGSIAAGCFAARHPQLIHRMVFFAPIIRRAGAPKGGGLGLGGALGPWRFVTVKQQHERFVEDVPPGHPPVLLDRHFAPWAQQYLASDPTSAERAPPSVKTPNGPLADIAAAWSGALGYDPARITAPVAIVRGAWDSLCNDADAAWLTRALSSSPQTRDVKIPRGTHLMHLEEGRGDLYLATEDFLKNGGR